jgi:MoaA/NifB/PqqE/SkfB family radical SAM enzyme
MKILRGVLTSRLKKLKRHFYTIVPHVTPGKVWNALRVELEFQKGRTALESKPYWAKIETSRVCNLQCPGCYAHGGDTDPTFPGTEKEKRFMSLELFKTVLDPLKKHVFAVQLYDEGEPMLNPDIYRIIRYARKSNVGTVISSNFSMPLKERDFLGLIDARLDRLVIGIDGCSQEVYEKTRVNGNLERVISNTRQLIAKKKQVKRKRPLVEIQFVQKPGNMHELEGVEAIARELGADMFTPIKLGAFWVNVDPAPTRPPKKCAIPWSSMVTQWNGDVSVCPLSDSTDLVVSRNMAEEPFNDIWNSDYYRELRAQHVSMPAGTPPVVRAAICMQCDFKR